MRFMSEYDFAFPPTVSLAGTYGVTAGFCPRRAAVAMGDNMSKRLKFISASEAEMEERCFPNLYPDWDHGVLASNPGADVEYSEPFDAEGKVIRVALAEII